MADLALDCAPWVKRAIADETSSVFGVTGGMGSAKTHSCSQLFTALCFANIGSPQSGIYMPLHRLFKSAIIPTLKKVYKELNWNEGQDYRIVQGEALRIELYPIAHTVRLYTVRDPASIVADEISHAWVDECGDTKDETLERVTDRVRGAGRRHQTIASGVPQGVNNWFAKKFFEKEDQRWKALNKERTEFFHAEKKFKRYRLRTSDNPYLDLEYSERQRAKYAHNPNFELCFVEGHFAPLVEGLAYSRYRPQIADIPDLDADPHVDLEISFDFGKLPLAWVAIQERNFYDEKDNRERKAVVIANADRGATQLPEACVEIAAKFDPEIFGKTPIRIFGDRSGHGTSHKTEQKGMTDFKQVKKYLNELGFKHVFIEASDKVVLEPDSVGAVNDFFLQDALLICECCDKLRSSFLSTQWQTYIRKLAKPSGEHWTHHGDALKYWCFWNRHRFLSSKKIVYGSNKF